ncbi:hypothetical protein Hanom_Chr02g00148911 [Helianthus anomalus]
MDILKQVGISAKKEAPRGNMLVSISQVYPPSRVPGKWVCGGASDIESRVKEGGKARESL